MKFENVNANKLLKEFNDSNIFPDPINLINDEWDFTFDENVDMELVKSIVDAHNIIPIPLEKNETELLKEQLEMQQQLIDTLMFEILPTLLEKEDI